MEKELAPVIQLSTLKDMWTTEAAKGNECRCKIAFCLTTMWAVKDDVEKPDHPVVGKSILWTHPPDKMMEVMLVSRKKGCLICPTYMRS